MSILKTLNITVMPQTAAALEEMSRISETTIGEVVDRLTLHLHASNYDQAIQIICEEILMICYDLPPEDYAKAIHDIAVIMAVEVTPDQEKLVELTKEIAAKQKERK
ncbi:MAG: hypothetical protein LUH07_06875 [Lachnospiraceae bacterium]|nr:hypothetical protein [Lachnospiraceae bacterium]